MLSRDFQKARPLGSTLKTAAMVAIVIAAGLFFAAIGFRPDITEALGTIRFLFNFVITLRPDGQIAGKASPLLIAPALLVCSALVELAALPERQWMPHLVGHNARFCLTLIPLLAIGPLGCFLAALRNGAPSNPGFAGAVAGLAAIGSQRRSMQQTAMTTARSSSSPGTDGHSSGQLRRLLHRSAVLRW